MKKFFITMLLVGTAAHAEQSKKLKCDGGNGDWHVTITARVFSGAHLHSIVIKEQYEHNEPSVLEGEIAENTLKGDKLEFNLDLLSENWGVMRLRLPQNYVQMKTFSGKYTRIFYGTDEDDANPMYMECKLK